MARKPQRLPDYCTPEEASALVSAAPSYQARMAMRVTLRTGQQGETGPRCAGARPPGGVTGGPEVVPPQRPEPAPLRHQPAVGQQEHEGGGRGVVYGLQFVGEPVGEAGLPPIVGGVVQCEIGLLAVADGLVGVALCVTRGVFGGAFFFGMGYLSGGWRLMPQ